MSRRIVQLACVLISVTAAGTGRAAVISVTPNTALGTTPVVVSFGGTAASFAFTVGANTGNGPGAAVATSGTAQVSNFGGVTDFFAGSTIDQTGELYNFAAFPTATLIPYSAADDFIGLAFTLPDGLHYGYAEVAGPSLVAYGYDSTPGASIFAGAMAAAVPEPASMVVLMTGITGLIAARRRQKV